MNMVHGELTLNVAVKVDSEDEVMGLLEANYNLNPNRIIAYRLTMIDCKGKEHTITVNEAIKMNLDEYVGL